ncbi:MAG TPA: YcaO-like family protein [Minicystis sp.]|nr:YcaO-like family protein [Minicystis sp.]
MRTSAAKAATSTACPLPDGWSEPEGVEDRVVVDGIALRRAGLSSVGPDGQEVTGAAVEIDGDPTPRARFELVERASTLAAIAARRDAFPLLDADGRPFGIAPFGDVFPASAAPACWRPARSNGVALHATFAAARERALWELAERDRVLRAWYGETRPRPIAAWAIGPLGRASRHRVVAAAFPCPPGARWSEHLEVAGVFGFPRAPDAPLLLGYAARPSLGAAIAAAEAECLQQLAFLDGEPIPKEPPPPGPSPMHHLEHFQYPGHHGLLEAFLREGHERHGRSLRRAARVRVRPAAPSFVDLTPAELVGHVRVVKALCADAAPLCFGESPAVRDLPAALRVHPIP